MNKKIITLLALSMVIAGTPTYHAHANSKQPNDNIETMVNDQQTVGSTYFLFKNIWGGESLQLAFDLQTMTIQATAKSGNFSNADNNFTLQLIDATSATQLISVQANTKYVRDFVTKIHNQSFKLGDIVALNIDPTSGMSSPSVYVDSVATGTNCVGKTQYFTITTQGLQPYTPNIQVNPIKILGQELIHTTTISGTTYQNAEISATVEGQTFTTVADASGAFQLEIHSEQGFTARTAIQLHVSELQITVYPDLLAQQNMYQETNTGYQYVLNADLQTLTTPFPSEIMYGRNLLSESGKKAWDIAYAALLKYDNTADAYPRDSAGNVEFYVDYESHGIQISANEAQYIQNYLVKNEPRMFLLKDWSAKPVYKDNVIIGQKFYIGNSAQNGNDYQQQLLATEQAVSFILSKITPDMDMYQIIKTIQVEFEALVDYKNAGTPGDIRGTFINNYAICGGYSKGFEYLLQRVGIENIWVTGQAGGYHAWNNINLYGDWYLADSTWGGKNWYLRGSKGTENHQVQNTYYIMPTLQVESIPWELGDIGQTIAYLTGSVSYENQNDGKLVVTYEDPTKLNTTMTIRTSINNYEPMEMTRDEAGNWRAIIEYDANHEETVDFFFTVDGKFHTIGNVKAHDLSVENVGNGMKNIVVATAKIDRSTLQELIDATDYDASAYTPTSFAQFAAAREQAKAVIADDKATELAYSQAYRALQQAIDGLIKANTIEFKGYNNVVFLTLEFDTITKQFKAVSNGEMVHPYQYARVYAKVDHYDQKGNLKGSYQAIANQTADEMAAGLNGATYESGDYLQLSHLEKNNRLVIQGYVNNAPYDLSTGSTALDLATARFYLDGESLSYSDTALDLSADKSALRTKIAELEQISGEEYTQTSFASLQQELQSARALIEQTSVFASELDEAITRLDSAHADLKRINTIIFKGYNNNEFLTVRFNSETQQLQAMSNGQVANPYSNGTYASIKHFDKQGNVKATYNVSANQNADAIAAQLDGTHYETGDYLQLTHKEQTGRLVIRGYVADAPSDFSNGVQTLDLTTARFYLDGESFKFSTEALDYTADTTELQTLVAQANTLTASDYTATTYANVIEARDKAQTVIETFNVTDAVVQAATETLQQAIGRLRLINEIQIKGYNNEIALRVQFNPTTQTLHAVSNGQVVHRFHSGTYASMKHYDQQGNVKAIYNVMANQTADEVAAQIEGSMYVTGDYFQFTHKEQANRLAITGFMSDAPADFTQGVKTLDLTTARFYLDGESFKFSTEALDYTADTTVLQTLVAQANTLTASDYTATTYANVIEARDAAQVVIETFNVTDAVVQAATETLQQAIDSLRLINEIQIKGYNNEIALRVQFNPTTQTLHAVSNGQVVHRFHSGTYASIKHYDQQGNVKAIYNVIANQTADEVAAQIEGSTYARGDYFQFTHKEQTNRLAITGFMSDAPADFTHGVQTLDLTTARFYLDGESFKFSTEGVDYTADTTGLQTLVAQANALNASDYTATTYANVIEARDAAQVVIETFNVTEAEVQVATDTLQQAMDTLIRVNTVELKGYNNVVFLTLTFDPTTQTLHAASNGEMVHPYQYARVYATVEHYDQQGKLKGSYEAIANQTADEMAAGLNNLVYETGDYLQFNHLEKNNRLVINGYVNNAPYDLSTGAYDLDLTTARFYLDGESFKFSSEALDYTADTTELQALVTTVDTLVSSDYTATTYANVIEARDKAQTVIETFNVTETVVQAATETLQQAIDSLRLINEIQIKGYNNEIALRVHFDPTTQTLHAVSNGQVVHRFHSGTYASMKHYDQQGNVKATYNVIATQNADAVAAQIDGSTYESGDYLQFTHKEQTNRLAITGYITDAPNDYSYGVQDLDLTTSYFYFDGESFKLSNQLQ